MKAQEFLKIKHTGDGDRFQKRVEAARRSKSSTDISTGKNAPTRAKSVDVTPQIRKTARLH